MSSKPPMTARKGGAPRGDNNTGPAFKTRSRSLSRHSVRSSNSLPGAFEDPELSSDKRTMPTIEAAPNDNPRTGLGKDRELSREINISEHPYYEKGAMVQPMRYRVRKFEEFRDVISDDREGPPWYEFISKAIEYDKTLYEKYLSLRDADEKLIAEKRINRRYKQQAECFVTEIEEGEHQLLLAQEELSHKEIDLEQALSAKDRLQEEEETLVRRAAENNPRYQREDTVDTQNTASNPQNWRPRGIKPSKPLRGEDPEEYSPWAYSIRNKLKTDSPLYADESEKVGYALSHMEAPIFGAMHSWVADTGDSLTSDALFEEIEHYMGIHLQSRDAKKELIAITMKGGESVSEYYHRIFKLWQKAKTPVDERIEKFLVTLKSSISSSLMGSVFTEFRLLLDEARRIEDRRKDVAQHFPRPEKQLPSKNAGKGSNFLGGQSTKGKSSYSPSHQIKKTKDRPSTKPAPTIVKPTGWTGAWYDPDPNPKKLMNDDRETLSSG